MTKFRILYRPHRRFWDDEPEPGGMYRVQRKGWLSWKTCTIPEWPSRDGGTHIADFPSYDSAVQFILDRVLVKKPSHTKEEWEMV